MARTARLDTDLHPVCDPCATGRHRDCTGTVYDPTTGAPTVCTCTARECDP